MSEIFDDFSSDDYEKDPSYECENFSDEKPTTSKRRKIELKTSRSLNETASCRNEADSDNSNLPETSILFTKFFKIVKKVCIKILLFSKFISNIIQLCR